MGSTMRSYGETFSNRQEKYQPNKPSQVELRFGRTSLKQALYLLRYVNQNGVETGIELKIGSPHLHTAFIRIFDGYPGWDFSPNPMIFRWLFYPFVHRCNEIWSEFQYAGSCCSSCEKDLSTFAPFTRLGRQL